MPNTLTDTLDGTAVWFSPLLDWATALAPQAGWALGVELVRGGLLLLVIAVAIRAAGGVRGRYRILSAGIILALLLPLAGVSPGVWRVGVPFEMSRASGGAEQPVAGGRVAPIGPDQQRSLGDDVMSRGSFVQQGLAGSTIGRTPGARTEFGVLAAAPIESRGALYTGQGDAGATPAPASTWSVMGWTVADARAMGDRATAWIDSVAGQPLMWVGLWAFGAAAVLLWGVLGVLRLAVIARTAHAADDRWLLEAERVMRRLRIRRAVRVVVSSQVPVPMTWGVWRPIVVVPTAGDAWDAERRRVVLTHELVHVRRFDWALQVAAWVVVSLHWCNPLAWWAVRRLAVERERSCDAAVVASGTRPSAYASHLLDIARAMSDVRSPVHALGMAKASELEGRLMSILNGTRRGAKRSMGAAVLVMCAGLAAAAVVPEAIPPEKQAELDRREAELAQLEAKLAQKRLELDRARVEAEVAAVDERDRAEAVRIVEGRARLARDVEGSARAAYVARVDSQAREGRGSSEPRAARAPRPSRAVTVGGVQARAVEPISAIESRRGRVSTPVVVGTVVAAEPSRRFVVEPPEPVAVEGRVIRSHSGALQKWQELSGDKDALREVLSGYRVLERAELVDHWVELDRLQDEIEVRSDKLELIVEGQLRPYQAELEIRQAELEPYHARMGELQRQMQAEMEVVEGEYEEQVREQFGVAHVAEIEQEFAVHQAMLQDQLAVLGEKIQQAARAGDLHQIGAYEQEITALVHQHEERASDLAQQAESVRVVAGRVSRDAAVRGRVVVEGTRERMGAVHSEMNAVHEGMEELHEGMEGVHHQMEGVHVEMEAVHHEMQSVHERIDQIIREEIGKIIREALEEQGLSAENPKALKVIEVARSAIGNRMMMTGASENEMVHVTDPHEHFRHMREAVARVEAVGDLELSDRVDAKLTAALKAAADRSEVLRFRVRSDAEDGGR